MTETTPCLPPPGTASGTTHVLATPDGLHVALVWETGMWGWPCAVWRTPTNLGAEWRYVGPLTMPTEIERLRAENARLREALESLMEVQPYATGWDNGVTDLTGTISEADYWHSRAMDTCRAVMGGHTVCEADSLDPTESQWRAMDRIVAAVNAAEGHQ